MLLSAGVLLAAHAPAAGARVPPPAVSRQQEQEKEKEKPKKTRVPRFVIFGTVFTAQGFALPGAEIRVRRAGEKKVRGEARSDRRGEFGVRVEPGFEYEVEVKAKEFAGETQKVDARTANRAELVFRLAARGGKSP